MEGDERVFTKPLPRSLSLVRVEIVHHDAETFSRILRDDLVHEVNEVPCFPRFIHPRDGFACFNVNGGQHRPGPMADIFIAPSLWFFRSQIKKRLCPVQCLNPGFFVHAKHDGVVGRVHVKTDHFKELLLELGPKKIGRRTINRRTPKTNAAIKALVPIRAECWNATEPGWIEADTVAHCGGDMSGSFLWTLTATDIYSGWTEVRASWNRGQHSVCGAFAGIEEGLPFTILGVDTDNGGEFLNNHLHTYFTKRKKPVEMSRSRPYQKNDQAHVEQKNSTHVRQLLGHDRLGHDFLVKPVFELLEAWSVWRNCFTTTFKQIDKLREGSKTVRKHEKVPLTPGERLLRYCRELAKEWKPRAADVMLWILLLSRSLTAFVIGPASRLQGRGPTRKTPSSSLRSYGNFHPAPQVFHARIQPHRRRTENHVRWTNRFRGGVHTQTLL
jgi:hypothetical protein